jgi:hypothetical protein
VTTIPEQLLFNVRYGSVADPHRMRNCDVDPDPIIHLAANPTFLFDAYPDLAPHQSDANLQPLA